MDFEQFGVLLRIKIDEVEKNHKIVRFQDSNRDFNINAYTQPTCFIYFILSVGLFDSLWLHPFCAHIFLNLICNGLQKNTFTIFSQSQHWKIISVHWIMQHASFQGCPCQFLPQKKKHNQYMYFVSFSYELKHGNFYFKF